MHGHGVQSYDKRGIGLAVVLTIVTCGIYLYYWLYQLLSTLYRLNNRQSSAGLDLILSLITCGIYTIYLGYKMGKLESEAYQANGLPFKDDSVLYLILAIFGLTVINLAIIQSGINNMPIGGGLEPHSGTDQNQGNGPRNDGFF